MGGFRLAWDHGWVGFKSTWAVCGHGWSLVLVASHGSSSDRRGLKKLSRMGFLGGLVLCNFVYFHKFWFNLSYVFCLVSFSLSFFSDEKV